MNIEFELLIQRMRASGEHLVLYNFPKGDMSNEDDLHFLKSTEAVVDGYDVVLYYNKADHEKFIVETLQVFSEQHPFLPFSLVIKIARKFLGSDKLTFIQMLKIEKQVYCWTVYKDYKGNPIDPPHKDLSVGSYEGFEYICLNPKNVNFY